MSFKTKNLQTQLSRAQRQSKECQTIICSRQTFRNDLSLLLSRKKCCPYVQTVLQSTNILYQVLMQCRRRQAIPQTAPTPIILQKTISLDLQSQTAINNMVSCAGKLYTQLVPFLPPDEGTAACTESCVRIQLERQLHPPV